MHPMIHAAVTSHIDVVMLVTRGLGILGARIGDWLIVRPDDKAFPLELHRILPISALAVIELHKLIPLRQVRDLFETTFAFPFAVPLVGARPGDELLMCLDDEDAPLVLRRTYPAEMLSVIPDEDGVVTTRYAERARAAQVSSVRLHSHDAPVRVALKLVG